MTQQSNGRFRSEYADRRGGDEPLRRVRVIECSKCDARDEIHDTSRRGLAASFLSRRFAERGWFVGASPSKDKCPACYRPARKDEHMNTPSPRPPAATPAPKAEPPRQMERADARRIRDALDEHYLEEDGCYRDSFTDDALAQKLGVPRAWVSGVREQFYGPEKNQSDAKRQEDIRVLKNLGVELQREAEKLAQQGMDLMAKAEEYRKRLDAL